MPALLNNDSLKSVYLDAIPGSKKP